MAHKRRRSDIPPDPIKDPRFIAAVDLIGHTGSTNFQIRYCDEVKPIVWIAAAQFGKHWECAAAMNPLRAVFRLCDSLMDGGLCVHCNRPSGFEPSIDPMPMSKLICWYQWDPELKVFRRGCSGDGK
jgi:hypothetical protein